MRKKVPHHAIAICDIIKVCAQSGVTHFRNGTLEINFGSVVPANHAVTESSPPQEIDEREALAQSKADLMENELSLLQITDPFQFEEMVAADELRTAGVDGDRGVEEAASD